MGLYWVLVTILRHLLADRMPKAWLVSPATERRPVFSQIAPPL